MGGFHAGIMAWLTSMTPNRTLGEMEGLENTWNGRVLARLVKATRRTHNRTEQVIDEVQELEGQGRGFRGREPAGTQNRNRSRTLDLRSRQGGN